MAKGTIWELPEFKPHKKAWTAKRKELFKRRGYYDGTVYSGNDDKLGWLKYRVGKEIKPLFLPLARAVDIDAGIIPGNWLLGDEDTPESKVNSWEKAKKLIFKWSKWATKGVLYVHYGAQYGVSALKVSDLQEEKRIEISAVDPTNLLLVYEGEYTDVPSMSIWVEKRGDGEDEVEFAEVITATEIKTYIDGLEQEVVDDRDAVYPNLQGRVPYFEVLHMENGEVWGEATFQKAMGLLDEVNQLATDLADIIKDHGEPQWAVSGAEPSDLEHDGDKVWFLPEGSKVEILLPPIDIPGVLEFIREIKDGVEEALPELSFDELRSKDKIATATLELQLIELILKVKRTRPNYDQGLIDALRFAGQMAAGMSLPEIVVLDDEDLVMDVDREILPMDPQTRMSLEMQEIILERERAMGMDEGGNEEEEDEE